MVYHAPELIGHDLILNDATRGARSFSAHLFSASSPVWGEFSAIDPILIPNSARMTMQVTAHIDPAQTSHSGTKRRQASDCPMPMQHDLFKS